MGFGPLPARCSLRTCLLTCESGTRTQGGSRVRACSPGPSLGLARGRVVAVGSGRARCRNPRRGLRPHWLQGLSPGPCSLRAIAFEQHAVAPPEALWHRVPLAQGRPQAAPPVLCPPAAGGGRLPDAAPGLLAAPEQPGCLQAGRWARPLPRQFLSPPLCPSGTGPRPRHQRWPSWGSRSRCHGGCPPSIRQAEGCGDSALAQEAAKWKRTVPRPRLGPATGGTC